MSSSAITFGPSTVSSSNIVWSEPVALRNKIINGNFDIWQRGTSFNLTANNTFTADRWAYAFDGSGATRNVSRQNFAINQTEVSGAPKYFINSTQSVAGTGGTFNALVQRIESVRTFAGQTVTISFWAKSSTGSFVRLSLGQRASTSVFHTVISATLTSAWTKYTGTIALPAIASGVTEDGNDHLELSFNFLSNATHNIDIAQVQIEAGSVATPFEHRPIGTELALCQRYYEILSVVGNQGQPFPMGVYTSTTSSRHIWIFSVQKRAIPNSFSASSLWRVWDFVNTAPSTTTAPSLIEKTAFSISFDVYNLSGGITPVQYRPCFLIPSQTAGTHFISVDAEL